MRKKENLLHLGWTILRVGIGISIFLHGLPKILGGQEVWTMVGSNMAIFGIDFGYAFWGLLAALTEGVGGLLFAAGLLFRPVAVLLTGIMIVAMGTHLAAGDQFMQYGHALDLLIVFAASILVGPGKYSLDSKFIPKIS